MMEVRFCDDLSREEYSLTSFSTCHELSSVSGVDVLKISAPDIQMAPIRSVPDPITVPFQSSTIIDQGCVQSAGGA